ncbi:MAG TPA: SRPBCC family protein [Jatrophihabitans sp.]|nr:SRPBCC family protein [Jatrophihabitans sp.]
MSSFEVSRNSPLSPEQAWARLTDWQRHARYVPLTTMSVVKSSPDGVGTVFVARTGVGRFGFDDPMEIVEWQPPSAGAGGRCRIEKRGRVMLGWAELRVEPHDGGSRATWREDATPARLPAFARPASVASGRLLFGRVLRKLLDD